MRTLGIILTSPYGNHTQHIDSDSPLQLSEELNTLFRYLSESLKNYNESTDFDFNWKLEDTFKREVLCEYSIRYYKSNGNWYTKFTMDRTDISRFDSRTEMTAFLCDFIKSHKVELITSISMRVAKINYTEK